MKPDAFEKAQKISLAIRHNDKAIGWWKEVEWQPGNSFHCPGEGMTKEMVGVVVAKAVDNLIAEGKELQRQFDAL